MYKFLPSKAHKVYFSLISNYIYIYFRESHPNDTTLCEKVCQWLATSRWFSPSNPVSFTNKTDCNDITEILLKVALTLETLCKLQQCYWESYRVNIWIIFSKRICGELLSFHKFSFFSHILNKSFHSPIKLTATI